MPKSKKEWKRLKRTCGLAWDGDVAAMRKIDDEVMSRKGFKFHSMERSGKLPSGKEYVTFVYVR